MADPLISLHKVNWRNRETNILENISFTISAKEIVTIIGPNGAGKSTLVNLITGLSSPSEGRIIKSANLRIGYMPQHLRFDSSLPMNVERFLKLTDAKANDYNLYAERLGVKHIMKTPLQNLSGGELQRVLLTRAVARNPNLLVLDEPTQGVDVAGQAELYRHISDLRDELGCGVVMVSHDLHLVMAKTDTVICLNRHICCHGAPESVTMHPEYIQLFGKQAAQDIAIYTHSHDHEHDLHGDVVTDHHCDHEHK